MRWVVRVIGYLALALAVLAMAFLLLVALLGTQPAHALFENHQTERAVLLLNDRPRAGARPQLHPCERAPLNAGDNASARSNADNEFAAVLLAEKIAIPRVVGRHLEREIAGCPSRRHVEPHEVAEANVNSGRERLPGCDCRVDDEQRHGAYSRMAQGKG